MAGEASSEIGLPPEAAAPAPQVEAPKVPWYKKIGDIFVPKSQADALAGTTAGRIMPEATAQVAAEARKTETPVLAAPASSAK